ncbi:unnamed protein product [Paramecium primaurelia]|uniref:Uncharacterized protein n=1 Tax=Paramecium primaurelia TaxID=5886 RepID=A0A8S1MPH7_PARPR|nr:unnamed protein product [Paramecium primaurelia]
MNKGLTLSYSKQSTKLNLDQSTNQTDSPILQFLEKQKKRNIFYIGFRVVAVQIQLKHAYYLIEVNEYGKKWIMRIRFSQLIKFKKNLCKKYQIKLTLSSNFVFNQLSPDNMKKRAQKIQSFLNQIGVQIIQIYKRNFMILNSSYCQQFLQEQKCLGEMLIDYTEEENLQLQS